MHGVEQQTLKGFSEGDAVKIQNGGQGHVEFLWPKGRVTVRVDEEIAPGLIQADIEFTIVVHVGHVKGFFDIFAQQWVAIFKIMKARITGRQPLIFECVNARRHSWDDRTRQSKRNSHEIQIQRSVCTHLELKRHF